MERDTKTGEKPDAIEVTPEMINAGLTEFLRYDPEGQEPEEVVRAIFVAMIAESRNRALRIAPSPS